MINKALLWLYSCCFAARRTSATPAVRALDKVKEALMLSVIPSRMEVQPMNFYLAMAASH